MKTLEKKIWLFGSRKGQTYDDNSKYLFEYILKNHQEISPYWVTRNLVVYEYLKANDKPVLYYYEQEILTILEKAEFAFINITYGDIANKELLKNVKVVQLWHGTPMKKNNIKVFKEEYEFVSLASLEFLTTQELGSRELFDFKLTGYPRNDILLDDEVFPEYISVNLRDRLINSKIIIFLPTYNEEKDLSKNDSDKRGKAYDIWKGLDFEQYDRFLKENNYIFIFKPHALQSTEDSEIMLKMEQSDNFIIIDNKNPFEDIYEYLKYADILLTDYSSVLFDFLLLNKPVIFTCFNLNEYLEERGLRFDYHLITPGVKTSNWDQVLEELQNIVIFNQDNFRIQRMEVNHRFNYFKDANSSKRIIDLVLNKVGK